MPRSIRRALPESTPALSHAINLFLHKDRTSFFDDSTCVFAPFDSQPALAEPSSFNWNLQCTCSPLVPAFKYISTKLHERELSIALIVSEQEPYVLPVWPLPRKSQMILASIVRKAVKKFSLRPSWLTALASASNKCLPKLFGSHRPDSYLVRRSIVQHEVIFGEEGLTLLTIDHIYTFKQLLCTLSKKNWVPCARDVCLSSCVHLLRRINEVYTGVKVSQGYLARVYQEIEFQKEAYEEVMSAYNENYCTASIKDVSTSEPDYTILSEIASDVEADDQREAIPIGIAELPDTSVYSSNDESISPTTPVDWSTLDAWPDAYYEKEIDIVSPMTVQYPTIQRPSDIPDSPTDPDAPWTSAIPKPLMPRRASTMPTTTSPSSTEAEAWLANNPTPVEVAESKPSHISAPLKTIEERWNSEEPMSPHACVKTWVESWSTVAPGVLCENCHEVTNHTLISRRCTVK